MDGGKRRSASRRTSKRRASRRASKSASRRASKRTSRRASKKASRRSTKKNPWLAFVAKHRSSVIAKLQKGKRYGDDKKGKFALQQDAMREMSKMYHKK